MPSGRGSGNARGWDESDVRIRPGKGSRPRTKRRPVHADAASAMVVSVDRGRWGCVLLADGPGHTAGTRVITMRARELGRTPIVVGDHVGVVGDLSGARDTLERAVRLFEEQGAPGWADAARADLERVGARRPSSPGRLTTTERRVADLAVQGLANKEIARTLVVTVSTVEFHLRNTYTKLGIRSRAELAAALPS